MVQDRREPTIDAIKPERDEIIRHQSRTPPQHGSASRPVPQHSSSKRFPAGLIALFIALVAGGGTAFSYWQLQQSQQQLAHAEQRISGLESQLKMTTGESLETLGNVNEKLALADSEIRKLWGVAYDTNRKAIKANADKIVVLEKTAKEASDAVKAQKTALAELQTMSREQQLLLATLREDNNLQQSDIDKFAKLSQQMDAGLKKMQSDLPAKVAAHDEAIAAIDAFRRTVSADLLKIKQQLEINQ